MNNLRATRACDKLLPQDIEENVNEQGGLVRTVKNCKLRLGFKLGYKTAEKETIERACKLLYDFNKQMTSMFGPKAFLSCNQYTIDIDRFRKILEMEEE